MIQLQFIIQKFRNDIHLDEFISTIKLHGHIVKEVGPEYNVANTNIPDPDIGYPFERLPTICFGSIKMIDICKDTISGYPIAWLTKNNYKCTSYYPSVQKHLFNDKHAFFTASSIQPLKWDIYKWFSVDTCIFMRPDSGEKSFTAGIFDLQYFDKDWDTINDKLNPEDLILVSTPKNIVGEWRFICDIKPQIITYSTYRYQGKTTIIPSAPYGAIKKCEEILNDLKFPDEIFTVDICEDTDGNYWLMEINSFNSAGLYACNKEKVVNWIENWILSEKEKLNSRLFN